MTPPIRHDSTAVLNEPSRDNQLAHYKYLAELHSLSTSELHELFLTVRRRIAGLPTGMWPEVPCAIRSSRR